MSLSHKKNEEFLNVQTQVIEIKGILAWTQYKDWERNVEKQVSERLHQDIKFEQIKIIEKTPYSYTSDTDCLKVTVRVDGVDFSKLTEKDFRMYVKDLY